MNERIAELIRLSAVPADQVTAYAESKGLVETTEKLDVAKFAELIVKECCQVMESLPSITYHVGRSRMSEEIKKHFGVEE